MTDSLHENRFPGESDQYRSARNKLLRSEIELRERLEEVAQLRRKLPRGGLIKEDYLFKEIDNSSEKETKLSELFQHGKNSLIIYSFMYGPEMKLPCPMCTSFLDGLDSYAPHITQRVNLAVVAKSPTGRINDWAIERGWKNLRILSSEANDYNIDYFAETGSGNQLSACNVFTKTPEDIFHFYSTEVLNVPFNGHPRHVDLLWPIWNFFDLTPEGRGTDWLPKLSYD